MPWAIRPFCRKCRQRRATQKTLYCVICQPEHHSRERTRLNAAKVDRRRFDKAEQEHYQFYKSKAWRKARAEKAKLNPLCEDCDDLGLTVPMEEVDHIVRIKDGGERFCLSNLRSLCASCHAVKRAAEGKRTLPDKER